jgi:hypothetical protein
VRCKYSTFANESLTPLHAEFNNVRFSSHFIFVSIEFIVIQAKKEADSAPGMCWPENEDYFECIHGFKEKARQQSVVAERKRREKLGESFEIKS